MNKTITINKKEVNVSFSGYYDSSIGDLLFTQVMCDVFMPGNEVVPIAVEKEQIRLIVEGFKKRSALYDELRKEVVKGKSCYVINPRMRYDLEWLEEKKKVRLTKEGPVPVEDPSPKVETAAPQQESKPAQYTDNRRKFLIAQGFKPNEATKNWEAHGIRFPDAMIDKSPSDEAFMEDMNRLMNAEYRNARPKKS